VEFHGEKAKKDTSMGKKIPLDQIPKDYGMIKCYGGMMYAVLII
jgi:hypothetical protein